VPFQSQNLSTLHLCNYFKVHCTFVFFFTTTNSYFASSFSLAIPFLRSFSLSRDSCQSSFVFKHFLRAAFSTFPQFEKRQHSSTFDSFNYCLCYYFSSIQLSLESCKKISKNSQKKKTRTTPDTIRTDRNFESRANDGRCGGNGNAEITYACCEESWLKTFR